MNINFKTYSQIFNVKKNMIFDQWAMSSAEDTQNKIYQKTMIENINKSK